MNKYLYNPGKIYSEYKYWLF